MCGVVEVSASMALYQECETGTCQNLRNPMLEISGGDEASKVSMEDGAERVLWGA